MRRRKVAIAAAASAWLSAVMPVATQEPMALRQAPPAERAPSFTKDVAPILYKHCASCHRPGEIGPMSFLTYQDVRPWAKSIREKVVSRQMPPWFADSQYGKFRNDRRLSQQDIDTIIAWVNAGARQGNPADLPERPSFPEGWQIGTPDVVIEMPVEYQIPADGTVDYQYFEVKTNFPEDKWIAAGEVRVDDREHVHHATVYIDDGENRPAPMEIRAILPDGQTTAAPPAAQRAALGGTSLRSGGRAQSPRRPGAVFVNYAVGEDAPIYPTGQAKRLKAGATLIFQMHYTTNGRPSKDRSKLGLVFAKTAPARELRTGMIANATFTTPPGDGNHLVEAEAAFTDDVRVWTLHPHMHLRGKDMTYTAVYPDGRSEVLLRVPKFDFGWQSDFWLAAPIGLPKGSKLHVTAHFDNSPANPNNPDPGATVRWGDQTWEEMMIGYFTYTAESAATATTASSGSEPRR
jgi:mono/diheme cytochrome c family protein